MAELTHEQYKAFVQKLFNPEFADMRDIPWHDAMVFACKLGMKDLVEYFLTCHKVHRSKSILNDGLWSACQSGHRNLVDLLLENGADDYGWAFYGACDGNNLELAKLMGDRLKKDKYLQTSGLNNITLGLENACKYGNYDIVSYALKFNIKSFLTAYRLACDNRHFRIARLLLRRCFGNFNINYRNIMNSFMFDFKFNTMMFCLNSLYIAKRDKYKYCDNLHDQQTCCYNVMRHFTTEKFLNRFNCCFIGLYSQL